MTVDRSRPSELLAPSQTLRSIIRHRDYIKQAINEVTHALEQRATVHDLSKFLDDEFEGFSRINVDRPKFGTPEYHERMRSEKPTILRHYSRNSHHPEHGPMTFLDVIEMVADWWAAGKGYDNRMDWSEAVNTNLRNKGAYLLDWQIDLAEDVAKFLGSKLD